MLKTYSNKAKENVRKYIMDNCNADNYIGYTIDKEPQTWDEVKDFIISTFTNEMLRYDNRYAAKRISKKELFYEWCQGLPSALDTCYYYNRSAVDDLGEILEETEYEKSTFTELQAEEKLTNMIYVALFRI